MGRKRKRQKDGEWMKEWKKHCNKVTCHPHAGCHGAYKSKGGKV